MNLLTHTDVATEWLADELAAVALYSGAKPGQATLVERSAPAGAMPPLCARAEAETYRVLEGRVTFFVGDDVLVATPGDIVVAAAGVARTFRAESAARWLVLTRVSSLPAFLDFNRAIAIPAGAPTPEEAAALTAVGAANAIELLGPPGALPGGRKHSS